MRQCFFFLLWLLLSSNTKACISYSFSVDTVSLENDSHQVLAGFAGFTIDVQISSATLASTLKEQHIIWRRFSQPMREDITMACRSIVWIRWNLNLDSPAATSKDNGWLLYHNSDIYLWTELMKYINKSSRPSETMTK